MIRVLESSRLPDRRLRLWTAPDWPLSHSAPAAPGLITIEWVGRYGHPSGYGLLGGTLARDAEFEQPELHVGPFPDNLASPTGPVAFGLFDRWFGLAIADAAPQVIIAVAAADAVSSSARVFHRLATMLNALLEEEEPWTDEDMWNRWRATSEPATAWAESRRR